MNYTYQRKYTIYGVGYRAQLRVIDLTSEDIAPSIRKDKPTVFAYVLPSSANKFSAFSSGEQIYWGHSVKECLNIIKEKLKLAEVQLPESFSRYL
jgi:hypothetical protein